MKKQVYVDFDKLHRNLILDFEESFKYIKIIYFNIHVI